MENTVLIHLQRIRIFFVILCCVTSFSVNAQMVHGSFDVSAKITFTDYEMVWGTYSRDISAYDFRSGLFHKKTLPDIPSQQGSTEGHLIYSVFDLTETSRTYHLYTITRDFSQIDTLGEFLNPGQFYTDRDKPNIFYFTATDLSGATHLWQSDGTKAGTVVNTLNVPSRQFQVVEGLSDFIFIQDGQKLFYQNQNIVLTPDSNVFNFTVLRNSRRGLVLSVKKKEEDDKTDVYVLDSSLIPTKIISDIIVDEVFPSGNDNYLYIDTDLSRSSTQLIYYHFSSMNIGIISLDKRLQQGYFVAYPLGDRYCSVRNPHIGAEIAILQEDSLILLNDFVPGPLHGVKGNSYWRDDTLFCIMSNGMDAKDYGYKVVNDSIICSFPLDDIDRIDYINNGRVYQLKFRGVDANERYYDLVSVPLDKGELQPQKLVGYKSNWYKHFLMDNEYGSRLYDINGRVFEVELDKEGNSFYSFSTSTIGSRPLSLTSPEIYEPHILIADNVIKLDAQGRLQWVTHIGSIYEGLTTYSSVNKMVVDSEGNLIVLGIAFLTGKIGNDTIPYFSREDRCKYFIAKLDGKTGDVLWHKRLQESEFIYTYLDELSIDEYDNVYLSVTAERMPFIFDDQEYRSTRVTNILVKFDNNGDVTKLTPLLNNWTDTYGRTVAQGYSAGRKEIISLQSQASWNWKSPCDYRDWRYVTHQTPTDGSQSMLSASSKSDDLGWVQSGAVDSDGRIHKFGLWRGDLLVNGFYNELQSPEGEECNEFETFYAVGDPVTQVSARFYRNRGVRLNPVMSKSYGEHVYHLAAYNGKAHLFKFTNSGDVIGYKNLGFWLSSETSVKSVSFDVNNESIVIGGFRLSTVPHLGIPRYTSYPYFSALNISNKDWNADAQQWFEEVDYKEFFKEDLQLLVFPNPASDRIRFAHGTNPNFVSYEIVNSVGQVVKQGSAEERRDGIEISDLEPGIYIIRSTSNGKVYATKWVKSF